AVHVGSQVRSGLQVQNGQEARSLWSQISDEHFTLRSQIHSVNEHMRRLLPAQRVKRLAVAAPGQRRLTRCKRRHTQRSATSYWIQPKLLIRSESRNRSTIRSDRIGEYIEVCTLG